MMKQCKQIEGILNKINATIVFVVGMGLLIFTSVYVLFGTNWNWSINDNAVKVVGYVSSLCALCLSNWAHSTQNDKLDKILSFLQSDKEFVVQKSGVKIRRGDSSRLIAICLYAMRQAFGNDKIDYTKILPEHVDAVRTILYHLFDAYHDSILKGDIGDDNILVVTKFDNSIIKAFTGNRLLSKYSHFDNEHLVITAVTNIQNMLNV